MSDKTKVILEHVVMYTGFTLIMFGILSNVI